MRGRTWGLPRIATGYVTLRENGLQGPIPAEWGQLTQLRVLDLAGNELTGFIPAELGRLGELQELQLQDNRLTGVTPAAISPLPAR